MITEKAMRANLRRRFENASELHIESGLTWYESAQSDVSAIACEFGHTVEQVAAAMAHLSPKCPWARNKKMTRELVSTGTTKGMGGPISRAKSALISSTPIEDMKGPKTSSFAKNLVGRYETVTVDIWAYRAACPSGDIERMGTKEYRAIECAYKATAKHYGISPAQFQAIIWCAVRGKAD